MTDYTKVCWSCGKSTMEPKDDYYECTNCGATWNEITKLGPPVVEPGNVTLFPGGEPTSMRATHPTPGVTRRAARARSKGK